MTLQTNTNFNYLEKKNKHEKWRKHVAYFNIQKGIYDNKYAINGHNLNRIDKHADIIGYVMNRNCHVILMNNSFIHNTVITSLEKKYKYDLKALHNTCKWSKVTIILKVSLQCNVI